MLRPEEVLALQTIVNAHLKDEEFRMLRYKFEQENYRIQLEHQSKYDKNNSYIQQPTTPPYASAFCPELDILRDYTKWMQEVKIQWEKEKHRNYAGLSLIELIGKSRPWNGPDST